MHVWHKNNVEFWFAVCVVISVVFALIYHHFSGTVLLDPPE